MKYMIMMFGDQSAMADRSPEWVAHLIGFMKQIDKDLAAAGELVFQQGLVDPSEGITVSSSGGSLHTTKGPIPSAGDALAGFWIVDVDTEARAVDIAGSIASVTEAPVEVRQCADAPPER